MSKFKDLLQVIDRNLRLEDIDSEVVTALADSTADEMVKERAVAKIEDYENLVVSAFNSLAVENEDIKIDKTNIELAKKSVMLALDPKKAIKITEQALKKVNGANGEIVTASAYADSTDVVPAFNTFDSLKTKPAIKFTIAFNGLAVQQDPGAELLFPTIPVDPTSPGIEVTVKTPVIVKNVRRKPGLDTVDEKLDRRPLVKVLNDPDVMDSDHNKLVLVYREENKDLFVENVKERIVEVNGEKVKTKPVKIGVKHDTVANSFTDETLARGLANGTDALHPSVKIEKLYFDLKGKDSDGNDVVEPFVVDVSYYGVYFTNSTTGDLKSIILNATAKGIEFVIDKNKTLTANGEVSEIIKNLPQGYKVKLDFSLNGTGNTETGTIVLYANDVEIKGIYDLAGNEVPADSDDYKKIMDVMKTIKVTGYDREAYLTNINARFSGTRIESKGYTFLYYVPIRTGFSTWLPIVSDGDEGDLEELDTTILQSRAKINMSAYKTLNRFISVLRNTSDDFEIDAPSKYFVKKAYYEDTIDLTKIVDSTESITRRDAIREALKNIIGINATILYNDSNYKVAIDAIEAGNNVKPNVLIVTNTVIGQLIAGIDGYDDGVFKYKLAITKNSLMGNRIVFTFGGLGDKSQPHVLNFGFLAIAPNLVIPVVRSADTVYTDTIINFRYKHFINLPILGVLNITGIKEVMQKIAINFRNV